MKQQDYESLILGIINARHCIKAVDLILKMGEILGPAILDSPTYYNAVTELIKKDYIIEMKYQPPHITYTLRIFFSKDTKIEITSNGTSE